MYVKMSYQEICKKIFFLFFIFSARDAKLIISENAWLRQDMFWRECNSPCWDLSSPLYSVGDVPQKLSNT